MVATRPVSHEEIKVASALLNNPVSVAQLRELVWQKGGYQSNSLRLRTWPALLGVDRHTTKHVNYVLTSAEMGNLLKLEPIHQQVELDVARSMSQWTMLDKWSTARKAEKRKRTGDIIHAVIAKHSTWAFYFQGFHDIVSVISLVTGDHRLTYALVEQLCCYYFRDIMRDNFDLVSLLLKLLPGLIEYFDEDLAYYLRDWDIPPFFVLPWLITWFAHVVPDLNIVARLFDVFVGSHPLLPLYVSAALVIHRRKNILTLHEVEEDIDFGTIHEYLANLPCNTNLLNWEIILFKAKCMFDKLSPRALLHRSSPSLRDQIALHTPMSFEFPPPWFTEYSLPDWIQIHNRQPKKLGKRKMRRRHQITTADEEKKKMLPWPISSFYSGGREPSLRVISVSVVVLVAVLGILLTKENSFSFRFPSLTTGYGLSTKSSIPVKTRA